MISLRGGSGLGDAIYVQSVVRHLVEGGQHVEVCTSWPDVFRPLKGAITPVPFRKKDVTCLAHYANRRGVPGTTQFQDCCINAGVSKLIDLRLDWTPLNRSLIEGVKGQGRPVIVVQMPRAPFGRTDGFGAEFLPNCKRIQQAIDGIGSRALLVLVGAGEPLFKFKGIDLDLTNQTSVCDLLDIGQAADGFIGQCSFIIPLAESFSKPVMLVWSRKGLRSKHEIIRQMTPQKILHRPTSRAVIDDCSDAELIEAVDALCEQVRGPVAV